MNQSLQIFCGLYDSYDEVFLNALRRLHSWRELYGINANDVTFLRVGKIDCNCCGHRTSAYAFYKLTDPFDETSSLQVIA